MRKECEAFLAGQLAETWAREHRNVPAWAWLNMLSHTSSGRLAALRDGNISPSLSAAPAWGLALSLLARLVLGAAAAAGCGVEEVQRDVLIPLELELMTERPLSPNDLVDVVVGALNQYRS